ncbi:nucleotide disphospho-sugar-binding domain-containing protein [Nocardioides sp. W7]|uniref:glycosyltransferase n=1 Tax=Nocardioides sp. W7 TaxID=2931390 RepID=UPI001FCFA792|nr:nucleotide disphospho-sugar-binding domain-containing protein [Nocardioides sp. W7]
MTRFLAYLSPAVGHTLPVVPGLLELRRRGHDVHARVLPELVGPLTAAGLDVSPLDPRILEVPVTDYLAASDADRLASGQTDLIGRGRYDGPDLAAAIEEHRPDVLLVDCMSYGALTVAETSGLPRATLMPSVLPLPGRGIPPYGPGLRPMRGPVGRVRDALVWKVVERLFGKAMLPGVNALRREAGLPAYRTPLELYRRPDAVITLTGEPLEYPRTDLPDHVTLAGPVPWDLPAERPAYVDEPGDPWVLVTCSTDYQGDEDLARVAVAALRDEPVRVLLTLADAYDEAGLTSAGNVRVERFVPHGQVLPSCAAVVCHGGFGIVSRAMAAGVPSVVVPFGRDQPEIARRVTEAGAGVMVRPKELTPERLRTAVAEARALSDGAAAAAARLDDGRGAERFADAAERLARIAPRA